MSSFNFRKSTDDKNVKITLLVSTVDRRILTNNNLLNIHYNNNLRLVVVNQMKRDKTSLHQFNKYCVVINSDTTGLSKSRNIALSNVREGLALIVDDDVSFSSTFDEVITRNYFESPNVDVFTFKVNSLDSKIPFKKYCDSPFYHNIYSLMRVSSIEICLNIERLINSSIFFDERFGLGAKFPTGEENIFLADIYKQGRIIKYIPEFIVSHPYESTGKIFTYELLYGKGAFFRRVFKIKGFFLLLIFILKKLKMISKSKISLSKSFKFAFKGFFEL